MWVGATMTSYPPAVASAHTYNGILHAGAGHYDYTTEDNGIYDLWENESLNTADNGTYSSVS